MKVTINTETKHHGREEKKGWFRKETVYTTKYVVITKVEFTNEERALIDKYKLWDYVIYNHHIGAAAWMSVLSDDEAADGYDLAFHIKDLITSRGESNHDLCALEFSTVAEAAQFSEKMKTSILPQVKALINQTSATAPGRPPESFEL